MSKRAIVFDFGNVLIDLNYQAHFDAFNKLFGELNYDDGYVREYRDALINYEKGLISDDAFIWALQQGNLQVNPRLIVQAWNDLIGNMNERRFEMLEKLSNDYKLYILSNINNFHIKYIHKYLSNTFAIHDFESRYFEEVFYSHDIKMRKPDTEIYEYVGKQISLPPQDIFFIDDREENTEAAKHLGWKAQVHDATNDIADKIDQYLIANNFN